MIQNETGYDRPKWYWTEPRILAQYSMMPKYAMEGAPTCRNKAPFPEGSHPLIRTHDEIPPFQQPDGRCRLCRVRWNRNRDQAKAKNRARRGEYPEKGTAATTDKPVPGIVAASVGSHALLSYSTRRPA